MSTRWTQDDLDKLNEKRANRGDNVFNPYADKGGVAKVAEIGKKRGKYNNKKTEVNGIKFDSQKEAARYQDLKIQEFANVISDLRLQVKYDLVVNGVKVAAYVADFVYFKDGIEKIEDVKSDMTRKLPVYRLKKKLMKAIYGIEILET
jgi:Protein of unknown function (DUF1064)